MIDVVALGELLIDFTCVSTDADGYPTMAAHPGGAPANFLAALAKFGAKTALLGKVGSDSLGRLLVGTLENAGIDTRGLLVDDSVFTTLAFVTLDQQGDREFSFARKPGADTCITFEELDTRLIDEAKVFHFGTLSLTDEPARTATQKAVAYARSKGKLITYDPNLRKPLWRDLQEARQQCCGLHLSVLIPNCAFLFIGVAALGQGVDGLHYRAGLVQGGFGEPVVEFDAVSAKVILHLFDVLGQRECYKCLFALGLGSFENIVAVFGDILLGTLGNVCAVIAVLGEGNSIFALEVL